MMKYIRFYSDTPTVTDIIIIIFISILVAVGYTIFVMDVTHTSQPIDGNFILNGAFISLIVAPLIFIAVYIILLLAAVTIAKLHRLSRRLQVRHIFSRQTVIAQYEPPHDVHPAEMAFIYDQTFGKEEYLATLFDLEHRGHLKLTPLEDENDFMITLQPNTANEKLNDIDQHVLATLAITKRKQRIHWRDAVSSVVINDGSLQNVVESVLRKRGWLAERRYKEESGGIALFIVIALFGIAAAFLIPIGYIDILLCIALILSCVFWYPSVRNSYYRSLRMSPRFNRHFTRVWGHLEGYRIFIEKVELGRIRFANQDIEADYYNQTFPYAVALNLATDWQRRFKV